MVNEEILIVEDERIVAEDIKTSLQSLGYTIPAIVSSGEEAIKKTEENNPDLVLMDINLKGEMDGIETASQIRSRLNIPIVYLTAYTDEKTITRAKISEPFGYIIKPFDDKTLRVNIEMSLYKHRMERKLKDSEKWFSATLLSINDAVITTDGNGFVTFINPVAEKLTGWKKEIAIGNSIKEVFKVVDEETDKIMENHVDELNKHKSVTISPRDAILKTKIGMKIPIEESFSSIKDDIGNIIGTVLVFRDITKRKHAEEMLKQDAEELEKANIALRQTLDELLKRVEKQRQKPISGECIKVENENTIGIYLYSIKDEEHARSQFISMLDACLPALAVVRTPPQRFKKLLGRDVETVWLTTNRDPNLVCLDPSNITRLSMVLTEFFKQAPKGIVLFEGVEYLLSIVGFQNLLNLIQLLNDKIALIEGTIYLIFDIGVLDEKEVRYIQRECLAPSKAFEEEKKTEHGFQN